MFQVFNELTISFKFTEATVDTVYPMGVTYLYKTLFALTKFGQWCMIYRSVIQKQWMKLMFDKRVKNLKMLNLQVEEVH